MSSFDELSAQCLRPPGGGIPTYSAGAGAEAELQRDLYGAALGRAVEVAEVPGLWKASLAGLARARVALVGVPLDTGAGIRRGAAYGPRAVRAAMLEDARFRSWLRDGRVVELGDVFVNPHLLHDEMLSEAQLKSCRDAMYPTASPTLRAGLPVSALSQLSRVLGELGAAHPSLRLFVIGGDHSVAWPVTESLARRYPGTLGIVQPDAHTDLLPSRLGVKYCFGTWSFHANELLGRDGKLVQVGIRQSGRDRGHWESTTGVKQYWASDVRARPEGELIAELVAHLKSRGVRQVYFSNDIDGTDEADASATGTPAAQGLTPGFVRSLIAALGASFELVAADVMEVAPDLGPTPEATRRTCRLAADYALACIESQLAGSSAGSSA
jgi:agmatinase